MSGPLLDVRNLQVEFRTAAGVVRAVDGASFAIGAGETVGLVGESGSGKSVTSLAVMGLVRPPAGRVVGGEVRFAGQDLLQLPPRALRRLRGRRMAMIFQDPLTALNPFLTIAEQLTEITRCHLGWNARRALDRAVELLHRVGIPSPQRRIFDYPHQLSGGMRQRVMIAMAISCEPDLLIADEPTTALDVTVQAQILELLAELQRERGLAMLLITHDLGVVAGACQRVCVMYAGRIVEEAPVERLFHAPRHPYTLGLLESRPRLEAKSHRLQPIAGQPPDPTRLPTGCAFRPRCSYAVARCEQEAPPTQPVPGGGSHRCWVDLPMRRTEAAHAS